MPSQSIIFIPNPSIFSHSTTSYHSFDENQDVSGDELSDNQWNSWHTTSTQYKHNMADHNKHKSYQPVDNRHYIGIDVDDNDVTNQNNGANNTAVQHKLINKQTIPTKLPIQPSNKFELLPAGSVRSSVFNLSSATLGAGALALPYALQQSGLLIGICLLIGAYTLSCYSINLLIQSSLYTQRNSYETITTKLFTYRGISIIVDLNILLFCFGTCVAYLVGCADIIQPIMLHSFGFTTDSVYGNRSSILILFTMCIMLPLSCCKQINQLRFTSFIGVCTLLFLVLCIIIRTVQYCIINGIQYDTLKFVDHSTGFSGTIITMSIMMYAYTCRPNVFTIYGELLSPTPKTMSTVVSRSFMLSSSVYVMIGVSGWLHYGSTVQSDILRNIDISNDYLMAIAQLGLAISITLAYPLNVFPARTSILHIIWPNAHNTRTDNQSMDDSAGGDNNTIDHDDNISDLLFYTLTISVVGTSLFIALYTTNLSSVFAIIGSSTSAVVCFILPPIFYLCSTDESLDSWACMKAWGMLITGTLLGIVATATTVIQIMT